MENVLVKCTIKPAIARRMAVISSFVLVPISLVLLFVNFFIFVGFILAYAATLYLIRNVESFELTEDGIYVCRRSGSVIYGYRYFEIERVDMMQAGNYRGLLLLRDKFHESYSLTIRDKSRITVPEYVTDYGRFLDLIAAKLQDKLSNEVRDYIKAERALPPPF